MKGLSRVLGNSHARFLWGWGVETPPGYQAPFKGSFAETSFYTLDATSLLNEYQERLAIAEYDGHQDPAQAERIAYLDAFVSVLVTLPYDDSDGDWLGQRVKAAKEWLLNQGLEQPE